LVANLKELRDSSKADIAWVPQEVERLRKAADEAHRGNKAEEERMHREQQQEDEKRKQNLDDLRKRKYFQQHI